MSVKNILEQNCKLMLKDRKDRLLNSLILIEIKVIVWMTKRKRRKTKDAAAVAVVAVAKPFYFFNTHFYYFLAETFDDNLLLCKKQKLFLL